MQKNSRSVSSVIKENLGSTSERVCLLEDGTRSKNLRISGIAGTRGENFEQTRRKARKLMTAKMIINSVNVTDAHRVAKHKM